MTSLITLGINHATAPLVLRERLAFSLTELPTALVALKESQLWVVGVTILSTCNRTEIYVVVDEQDLQKVQESLLVWWSNYCEIDTSLLIPHYYFYQQQQAVLHLMRVASGLDSILLGEPHILGQLKQVYSIAKTYQVLCSELERLFQRVFYVAKRIRNKSGIGRHSVSFAYACCFLARQYFTDLTNCTILLVGAGEIIEFIALYLAKHNVKRIIITNRSHTAGSALAETVDAEFVALEHLVTTLPHANIIITATGSVQPVITKQMVEQVQLTRVIDSSTTVVPWLFIDLAVPRDIEPDIAELPHVRLHTVDDLRHVAEVNKTRQEQAIKLAELLLNEESARYELWSLEQRASTIVQQYRNQVEQVRNHLTIQAKQQLERGVSVEKVIELLAYKLTNQLTHLPTKSLRYAVVQQNEEYLQWLKQYLK